MLDFILLVPVGALLWAVSIGSVNVLSRKGVTVLTDDLRPLYRSR